MKLILQIAAGILLAAWILWQFIKPDDNDPGNMPP